MPVVSCTSTAQDLTPYWIKKQFFQHTSHLVIQISDSAEIQFPLQIATECLFVLQRVLK